MGCCMFCGCGLTNGLLGVVAAVPVSFVELGALLNGLLPLAVPVLVFAILLNGLPVVALPYSAFRVFMNGFGLVYTTASVPTVLPVPSLIPSLVPSTGLLFNNGLTVPVAGFILGTAPAVWPVVVLATVPCPNGLFMNKGLTVSVAGTAFYVLSLFSLTYPSFSFSLTYPSFSFSFYFAFSFSFYPSFSFSFYFSLPALNISNVVL